MVVLGGDAVSYERGTPVGCTDRVGFAGGEGLDVLPRLECLDRRQRRLARLYRKLQNGRRFVPRTGFTKEI